MRQKLVEVYFPHLKKSLRASRRFDIWFNVLVGLFHWWAVISTAVGRQVKWRGISYELSATGKIELIWRSDEPTILPLASLLRRYPMTPRRFWLPKEKVSA
jgi:hypothetical protein